MPYSTSRLLLAALILNGLMHLVVYSRQYDPRAVEHTRMLLIHPMMLLLIVAMILRRLVSSALEMMGCYRTSLPQVVPVGSFRKLPLCLS